MYVRYRKACCAGKKANSGTPPHLSALCVLLFLSLVGTVGTVQGQPMDTAGMYGAILLHEGAGGYVLVAVAVFTLAVVITVICMRLHERERQKQKRERKDKEDAI